MYDTRSGFKTSDQVQGQGVPRIGSGAYTQYVSISMRGATQPLGLLSPLINLSNRCEIPLYQAGRWGFETTSKMVSQ
jgi:hypothetical protein